MRYLIYRFIRESFSYITLELLLKLLNLVEEVLDNDLEDEQESVTAELFMYQVVQSGFL